MTARWISPGEYARGHRPVPVLVYERTPSGRTEHAAYRCLACGWLLDAARGRWGGWRWWHRERLS